MITIEEYMNLSTYKWRKHAEVTVDSLRVMFVSEFEPCGKESNVYIINEENGIIRNQQGDILNETV